MIKMDWLYIIPAIAAWIVGISFAGALIAHLCVYFYEFIGITWHESELYEDKEGNIYLRRK